MQNFPSLEAAMNDAAASGDVDRVLSLAASFPHLIDTVNPERYRQAPMHVAAENGQASVVETLHHLGSKALDWPDNCGSMPMHAASFAGHAAVVETLHRLGSTAIDRADDFTWTPMLHAAGDGHVSVIETLHRLGSTALDRVDESRWAPVHAAAFGGHAAAIETLHRLGSTVLNQPSITGETPMHLAARKGHAAVIETLIRLGSTTLDHSGTDILRLAFDIDTATDDRTVTELLLAAGVDPTALADQYPQQVQALLATPAERLQQHRHRLYFSATLLDLLLRE